MARTSKPQAQIHCLAIIGEMKLFAITLTVAIVAAFKSVDHRFKLSRSIFNRLKMESISSPSAPSLTVTTSSPESRPEPEGVPVSKIPIRDDTVDPEVIRRAQEAVLKRTRSFVQEELRPYAMKLHTRDQAPREGQQPAQTPFTQWQLSRGDYLRFLVDSLEVYRTFERLVQQYPAYASLRNTGLERVDALEYDIQWMVKYDPSLTIPPCGPSGINYSKQLTQLAVDNEPKFLCHYYNHYFAHTAGGRMIGKRVADALLGGHTLRFYEWNDPRGDVKQLLDNVRASIDAIANGWTDDQRHDCLEETGATFAAGGSLMVYMKPPANDNGGNGQ